jgi:hypothetical protein
VTNGINKMQRITIFIKVRNRGQKPTCPTVTADRGFALLLDSNALSAEGRKHFLGPQ